MGFAMRVNFVDVICENSLKNDYVNGKKMGVSFDIRLSYYRGHFLSDIDVFEVRIDDRLMEEEHVSFCLNGKEFSVSQIREAYTEFWRLLDPAHIKVYLPGGLPEGAHKVDVKLMLRVPYLPLPGGKSDHDYMPLDSCGTKVLTVREGKEEQGHE